MVGGRECRSNCERAMALAAAEPRTVHSLQHNWLVRLFDYKPFLIFLCLLPAAGFLLVFLSYPLGLGIWLAFTQSSN